MRKMLALLLIVVLVFSLASVVFANENTPSPTGTTAGDPDKPTDPTSPNTGDMVLLLIRSPARVRSTTLISPHMDVSFRTAMPSLHIAGSMFLIACGRTMSRSVPSSLMPSERPASVWP